MVRSCLSAAAAVALALCAGCAAGQHARRADLIAGTIVTEHEGGLVPVPQVAVYIRPVVADTETRRPDSAPEQPSLLRAASLSNDRGYFELVALSSDETFTEYGLLRGWKYEIAIQHPGYLIYNGNFTYPRGSQELSIALEAKSADDFNLPDVLPDGVMAEPSGVGAWGGPHEVEVDTRARTSTDVLRPAR